MNPVTFHMSCDPVPDMVAPGGRRLPGERYHVDHAGDVAFQWRRDGAIWFAVWTLRGESYVTVSDWKRTPTGYRELYTCVEQNADGSATKRFETVELRNGLGAVRTRQEYTWEHASALWVLDCATRKEAAE